MKKLAALFAFLSLFAVDVPCGNTQCSICYPYTSR
jgi:hypothetical protein